METVREPLDVAVAESAGGPDDIIVFVDFVLTQVIVEAPALVEAEKNPCSDAPVVWRIRKHGDAASARVIASQEPVFFRPTLARINHHLLNDQLHGGAIRRVLRQADRLVVAAIHTSNDSATGFWIRIALSPYL